MRLLHRYRVVKLGGSPKRDTPLYWTLFRNRATTRRVDLKVQGARDIAVYDALTGRFI